MKRISFVLALLLPSLPLLAQHGDWCSCGRHAIEPTFFQIDHTTATYQNEASAAFSRWDTYSNVFSWGIGNGVGGSNGVNEIIFFGAAATWNQYGVVIDPNVFGFAYIDPSSAFGNPPFNACPPPAGTTCGFFGETDIVINAEFSRGWTTAPPNFSDTGPASYMATALHEMGHTLGIHHNFDSLTTMNYYEDYATQYLSMSDAGAARGHAGQALAATDIATYPFRFSGFQYSGSTVASAIPTTVAQGGQISLRNFTIENLGTTSLANVQLRIYLSSNDVVSTSDHLIGTLAFATFTTWWDTTGITLTVPASVPPGTYYIGAIVSYNTSATDLVAYNNTWVLDAARRLTVAANQATHTLTVSGAGSGSGSVTGPGIACTVAAGSASGDCQQAYASGSGVTLAATPAAGSTLGGWSGACSGTSTCNVTMTADRSVTASFASAAGSCALKSLSSLTVSSVAVHEACAELSVGSNSLVTASGDLRLAAGRRVSFANGFSVAGRLRVSSCGNDLCAESSQPMRSGCHSCVTTVCAADSWCCDVGWDSLCVSQVESRCGLVCP